MRGAYPRQTRVRPACLRWRSADSVWLRHSHGVILIVVQHMVDSRSRRNRFQLKDRISVMHRYQTEYIELLAVPAWAV
jgi:hypothetical protein